MKYVSFNKVSLSFGEQAVLRDANFNIPPQLKIGLIGENGSGKTTILRLISGEIEPDSGNIEVARNLRTAHVSQLPEEGGYPDAIGAALGSSQTIAGLYEQLVLAERRQESGASEEYANLVALYSEAGGYVMESEARRFLLNLSFDETQLTLPFEQLSGGERARAAIAAALLARPNLLLLDEPDSHLDIAGLEWLQEQLARFHGSMVLVSHDRELLEGCCNSVMELDGGKLLFEHGTLDAYLKRKSRRLEQQMVQYLEQQRRMDRIRRDISRTEEKARDFDNRSTNDHWRRIGKKIAKTAIARKKRLDRELDDSRRIDKPVETEDIQLNLSEQSFRKNSILVVNNLTFYYGDRCLFSDVSLDIRRGQRFAITGRNGCGKTTLLETMLGLRQAGDGEVWMPLAAEYFYCDQHNAGLVPERSAYTTLEQATSLTKTQIYYALSRIGLKNRAAHKLVSVLSGGERTRLLLALLANSGADLLVLDEPTGHLDISSIAIIENVLTGFSGAVVFVSHDRRFISSVATDVMELENSKLSLSVSATET